MIIKSSKLNINSLNSYWNKFIQNHSGKAEAQEFEFWLKKQLYAWAALVTLLSVTYLLILNSHSEAAYYLILTAGGLGLLISVYLFLRTLIDAIGDSKMTSLDNATLFCGVLPALCSFLLSSYNQYSPQTFFATHSTISHHEVTDLKLAANGLSVVFIGGASYQIPNSTITIGRAVAA